MKMDHFIRMMWILAACFFGLAILGAVGELLGWWNDVGEAFMALGTGGGLIASVVALFSTSSKDQVARAAAEIRSNGRKLDEQTGKMDQQTGKMDQQTDILRQIRDRL